MDDQEDDILPDYDKVRNPEIRRFVPVPESQIVDPWTTLI